MKVFLATIQFFLPVQSASTFDNDTASPTEKQVMGKVFASVDAAKGYFEANHYYRGVTWDDVSNSGHHAWFHVYLTEVEVIE